MHRYTYLYGCITFSLFIVVWKKLTRGITRKGLCQTKTCHIGQHPPPRDCTGLCSSREGSSTSNQQLSVIRGMIMLIVVYCAFYIGYPKSSPTQGFLLFIQEVLLEEKDTIVKYSAKYSGVINALTLYS